MRRSDLVVGREYALSASSEWLAVAVPSPHFAVPPARAVIASLEVLLVDDVLDRVALPGGSVVECRGRAPETEEEREDANGVLVLADGRYRVVPTYEVRAEWSAAERAVSELVEARRGRPRTARPGSAS